MQCIPVFIGISRRVLNVRPAAFFFIKCSLQSNEIQPLYSSAQDGYESTQLYTVSKVSSSLAFPSGVNILFESVVLGALFVNYKLPYLALAHT